MSSLIGIFPLLSASGTDFAITTAGTLTGAWATGFKGIRAMSAQIQFVYGSGGTTLNAYLQTSLDNGNTAIDIAAASQWSTSSAMLAWNFHTDAAVTEFTPTDGSLTAGQQKNGILGDRFRLKLVVVGTYATSSLVAARICPR